MGTAEGRRVHTVVPVRGSVGLDLLGALSDEIRVSIDEGLELLQAFPLVCVVDALRNLAETLRDELGPLSGGAGQRGALGGNGGRIAPCHSGADGLWAEA